VTFRDEVRPDDARAVRQLVSGTGFFTSEEQEIAAELAEEAAQKGPESGYRFVFGEESGCLAGYSCYGLIPGTDASYDLYWIAVDPDRQGCGIGKAILAEVERRVRSSGGRRIYIETSSTERYQPTRRFYAACGYIEEAILEDFYRPGDSKIIYGKVL
jgi:GNAT superfamily N-acetyltransferase